jgi:hypothetical protein
MADRLGGICGRCEFSKASGKHQRIELIPRRWPCVGLVLLALPRKASMTSANSTLASPRPFLLARSFANSPVKLARSLAGLAVGVFSDVAVSFVLLRSCPDVSLDNPGSSCFVVFQLFLLRPASIVSSCFLGQSCFVLTLSCFLLRDRVLLQ